MVSVNFTWLGSLSVAMFVGSFVAGIIPIVIQLNISKIRFLSAFGGGLLIGTALVVIIPEGVATLYEYAKEFEKNSKENEREQVELLVGLTLLIGFSMMFIVEQISAFNSIPPTNQRQLNTVDDYEQQQQLQLSHITLHTFESDSTMSTRGSAASPTNNTHQNHHHTQVSAVSGMLIHSAADGVAMGAAMSSGRSQLELLVFFAILLHKAPTAFGLTSFLLRSQDASKRHIRHVLLLFSLAAPIATIVTGTILSMINLDILYMQKWVSLLLIFSGGSFLYVASVHVLPELQDRHGMEVGKSTFGDIIASKRNSLIKNTLIIVFGMFLPIIMQLSQGNHHHHQ